MKANVRQFLFAIAIFWVGFILANLIEGHEFLGRLIS